MAGRRRRGRLKSVVGSPSMSPGGRGADNSPPSVRADGARDLRRKGCLRTGTAELVLLSIGTESDEHIDT